MKKYILIITLLIACSCKDFLNQEPVLSQSDVKSLSTLANLNYDMASVYGSLSVGNWYGRSFILRTEMATSNGKKSGLAKYNSGRLQDDYGINYSINNISPLWSSAYVAINRCNIILENLEGKEGPNKEFIQEVNNIKAECLFFRAFSHFDLLRIYARPYNYTKDASHLGVPIITKSDQLFKDRPARNKVKDVYEQIIKDLTLAETLIQDNFIRPEYKDPKGVISKEVIQAFLSRVYLYMEDWQKASDYATKVINSGKYTLWTAAELENANCYSVDIPERGEVIFEVYGNIQNSTFRAQETIHHMTNPEGYPDGGASRDIYDLYEDQDVRKTLFVERDDQLWTAKYKGKGLAKPDVTNIIILRLSEMYLIRAEASIHGATGVNSIEDLKMIALSRNATPQPSTLEGVYTERRKEFAWEGHLWFDLLRTKRPMTREDYIGNPNGKDLEVDDFRWISGIDKDELEVNPNLIQNPGYAKK